MVLFHAGHDGRRDKHGLLLLGISLYEMYQVAFRTF